MRHVSYRPHGAVPHVSDWLCAHGVDTAHICARCEEATMSYVLTVITEGATITETVADIPTGFARAAQLLGDYSAGEAAESGAWIAGVFRGGDSPSHGFTLRPAGRDAF